MFWPSVFQMFFTLWPARQFLWPSMSERQALTAVEERAVSEAGDKCKIPFSIVVARGLDDSHTMGDESLPIQHRLYFYTTTELCLNGALFRNYVKGLIYGTSACNAHLVSVPFRDGVKELSNMLHLQVTHWVNLLGPDLFISSTGRLWKTYNFIAEMPAGAPVLAYTFFCEHPGITLNTDDIGGNVLVVKHAQGKKYEIMDCDEMDVP
ncbi:hypothetical protein BDR05DRAFT_949533 [Suillus weaverae]|nr:hypothetical protein BDR05DRAFT_949533 [Suillus weaverae]